MAATATDRKLLVDGAWIETGTWSEIASPYDGSTVARVARAEGTEARAAVDAAARLISSEAGKPLKAARVEVARAMSTYTMAAVEAHTLASELVSMDATQAGAGKLGFTQRLPIGIVGAISPFNLPLNLVAHKIAPALAAGCARSRDRAASRCSESSSTRTSTRRSATPSRRRCTRSSSAIPQTRRPTSDHSSGTRSRPRALLDRPGPRRRRHGSHGRTPRGWAPPPHRRRAPRCRREALVRRGVRARLHARLVRDARRGIPATRGRVPRGPCAR